MHSKKIPARTCKDTIQIYIHVISYLMLEESLQNLEGQHHPTPQILSSGKPAAYKGDSHNYPKNKWLNHHKSTSTPIIAGSIPAFMLKNLTFGQTGKQIAILVASFLICLPVKSPSTAVFFDSLPPVAVPSRCEGLAATAAALRWSRPRAPQRKRTLGGQAVVGGWEISPKNWVLTIEKLDLINQKWILTIFNPGKTLDLDGFSTNNGWSLSS